MRDCLGNQHAVEGIAMDLWEINQMLNRLFQNGQRYNSVGFALL
jgi:hypothetical protein